MANLPRLANLRRRIAPRKAGLALLALVTGFCGCGGDPAPAAPAKMARAKFCNLLDPAKADRATIEIGQPKVTLGASVGKCSAAIDETCTAIPVGNVPVRILDGNEVIWSADVQFDADAEYVMAARQNERGQYVLARATLRGPRCDTLDPMILILTGNL